MTNLIPELRSKTYMERLEHPNLMTLEQRHIRQDMITMYNILNNKIDIEIQDIIDIVGGEAKTRGNSFKIRPKNVRLNVRKHTYIHIYIYFCRIWKIWNLLPEDTVRPEPSLNVFKSKLERNMKWIFKGHEGVIIEYRATR